MSETTTSQRINPGYSVRVADAELSTDMKPCGIVEALSMLTLPSGESRRTVGLGRETCKHLLDRLRQPA
jgi:hypothetical protein